MRKRVKKKNELVGEMRKESKQRSKEREKKIKRDRRDREISVHPSEQCFLTRGIRSVFLEGELHSRRRV